MKRLALILMLAALTACSDDTGNDRVRGAGDCQSQVQVDGNVFTSYGYTKHSATRHRTAERVTCPDVGMDAAESVFPDPPAEVTTWTFSGYPPEKVLGVRSGSADSYAVFVADSVVPTERDRIFDELSEKSDPRTPPAAEFATYAPRTGAMAALGGGTLAISGGCVVLRDAEGGNELVALSAGTTMVGNTLHVVDSFGKRADMKLGDQVRFGGGYVEVLPEAHGFVIPKACSRFVRGEVFLAQALVSPKPDR